VINCFMGFLPSSVVRWGNRRVPMPIRAESPADGKQ
jgi:hypothetical protein